MHHYLLRRLLLIPLTLLGLSMLIFCMTRLVPGGPIEQMLQEQAIGALSGDQASSSPMQSSKLSDEDREKLEELFNLNEPVWKAYLQWLGLMPRKIYQSKAEFQESPTTHLSLSDNKETLTVEVQREGNKITTLNQKNLQASGWIFKLQSPQERAELSERADAQANQFSWRVLAYQESYEGLLQGSLGLSYKYNEPVGAMIAERLPVSIYLGLLATLITYGISLPLGVLKALWHKGIFDNLTSLAIFVGYAVPGFALGAILLVYLGARHEIFPLYGLTSPDFATMDLRAQIEDIAMHTVLPLSCYVVSSFALTTMMMKNNLMDQLSSDYVRTAVGKGLSFHQAVWRHALRNALIPLASGLGSVIGLIIGGSLLIERVFDIQGFGLLGYQALVDKDYTLIMGTLLVSAMMIMLGNLLSDILVFALDKRIRFD